MDTITHALKDQLTQLFFTESQYNWYGYIGENTDSNISISATLV